MTNYLPYLPALIAGAVGAVIATLILLVRDLFDGRKLKATPAAEEDGALVTSMLAAQPPKDWAGQVDRDFDDMMRRTGLGISAGQGVGLILLAGVAAAAALYFWREDYWLTGFGLLAGMILPFVAFLALQGRWRKQLQDQLPDAFFLLARSLRAGLSLEQAIELVGEQGVKPLADEFRRASERAKLGLPVTTALARVAERVQLTDFNVFVSVVALHREVGGNLALLLDRVATTTRDRNQYRGHFRAATALGRVTGLCISLASPVLLLVYGLLQPDYLINFARNPIGLMALGVALALEIIGVFWIYMLLRVEY